MHTQYTLPFLLLVGRKSSADHFSEASKKLRLLCELCSYGRFLGNINGTGCRSINPHPSLKLRFIHETVFLYILISYYEMCS